MNVHFFELYINYRQYTQNNIEAVFETDLRLKHLDSVVKLGR